LLKLFDFSTPETDPDYEDDSDVEVNDKTDPPSFFNLITRNDIHKMT